jgi:biopolymer transport protein ExbD
MATKKKGPYDDDVKMNLTPMIDMTFLLVVFFMLSIDLTRKEFVPLALPVANKGIEDKPPADEEIPRYVINLLPDGNISLKGNIWPLASENPEEQRVALDNLRRELRNLTNNPLWRNEDRSSKVPVMIHGDRDARWQYVQWIMQVCADPQIAIYRIQFAVKKPKPEEN